MNDQPTNNDEYIKSLPPIVQERIVEAQERDLDDGGDIVLLHGYEAAMIGTTSRQGRTVAVYSETLCVRLIMDEMRKDYPSAPQSELYADAVNYWDDSVIRGLPYMGERAPIIVEGFEVDRDKWTALLGSASDTREASLI